MEQQIIANGGVQYVPQIAVQYVYLDFDGELTSYNGEILTVDNVEVQNSSLTEERIALIVAELNTQYALQNVIFVTEKPEFAEYSTIYIGKTSAFDSYGNFTGLAETIDLGNQISTDNAFVMLDSSASNERIIEVISHETCHLLGTLDHGGSGLAAYAYGSVYHIKPGATASGLVAVPYDSVVVSQGGLANSCTLSGGKMIVLNGGSANNTKLTSHYFGAMQQSLMEISSGGIASNTTVFDGILAVYSDGVANNTTVAGNGIMHVREKGIANNTVLSGNNSYCDCNMYVSSGGTANGTIIKDYGSMTVFNSGIAYNTILSANYLSSSMMTISSGGVANGLIVSSGCSVFVSSGGKITGELQINSGAVYTYYGAEINFDLTNRTAGNNVLMPLHLFAEIPNFTITVSENQSVGTYRLASDSSWLSQAVSFTIGNGTIDYGALKINVNMPLTRNNKNYSLNRTADGILTLIITSSGGNSSSAVSGNSGTSVISSGRVVMSAMVASGGILEIKSGGVADNTTVKSFGSMCISSGGVANSTTVNSSGYMCIYSGGTATEIVENGGYVEVKDGAEAIFASNTISGLVLSNARMTVHKNTIAESTTVRSYGYMCIDSGGVANSTTVNSGGRMYFSYGGCHKGSLQIENGAVVSAYGRAIIDFTVADRTEEDGYLINDLSRISGAPTYTITVAADQTAGTYKLAQGAGNFTGTISIGNGTVNYGSITINGEDFIYDNRIYSLDNVGGNLTLSILFPPEVPTAVLNTTDPTNQDVVVTVTYSEDSTIRQYKIGNGEWLDYQKAFSVSDNSTVYFRAANAIGESFGSIIISNIDKIAPTLEISGNATAPTNQNITLTATASDGTVEYFANGKWNVGNLLTVTSNDTYKFRVTDAAGNVTEKSVTVDMIDKVAPTLSISGNVTVPTNQDVVLTAIASDGTVEYFANSKWNIGNSLTVTENGTYQFRVTDAAGNSVTDSIVVNNIDKAAPDKPTTEADITSVTNGSVTVSAVFSKDTTKKEYSLDNKNWQTYTSGIVMTDNGTVYFRGTDAAGNISDVASYKVSNIDKVAPDASGYFNLTDSGYSIFFTGKDANGIAGYRLKYSTDGVTFVDYSGFFTEESIEIGSIGNVKQFQIQAIDNAGNASGWHILQENRNQSVAGDDESNLIFISSKYTGSITGRKQNGIVLEYGKNAFATLKAAGDTSGKTVILLDSKNSGEYVNQGTVAGVVVIPTVKKTDNSYSYKANSAPKGTLNLVADTGSTEFIRFATVNITGATVGNVTGGKESSTEDTKTAVDKKGTVTDTGKSTYTANANGKLIAINSEVDTVKGYSAVTLTNSEITDLQGGNIKITSNNKSVDGETKDQKTSSSVNDNIAAGSVTLKAGAFADTVSGFSNVTLTGSTVGDITNFTSKDSKSDTATYDEAKNTVARKVTLSHTETTAGTLKATDAVELGDVTGFATVTLKNVEQSGDFCRKDADGDDYSTVKETLNIKTNKDGSVTGTYNKTETFTRAGKFTATNSTAGDIENFSTVTLDGSTVEDISNFTTAKVVTKGTASWDNMSAYGRPADYDIDLAGWNLTEIETESLNGSVTLKNGSHADSITNFKNVSLTGSEVEKIDNVNKVTVNKGDSFISSYTGTEDNDTLTIAKNAVLTASKINLGAEAKDTLAINGTLILTGSADNLPQVEASKITGKGEIAADSATYAQLDIAFANILDVGETSNNFRGTAYENADDKLKKAIKWDGKEEYNGWLGDWEGYTCGSDEVDYIKFKADFGDELIVDGISDDNWTLYNGKGNQVNLNIFADGEFKLAGEYILKLENDSDNKSQAYTITLA